MFPPATHLLVQSMIAEIEGNNRSLSAVYADLASLGLDPRKITVTDDQFIDVFHPTAKYSMIERFGSTSEHFPDTIFIDGLNVVGSRKGSFGNVDFSVQISYDFTNMDIIEKHNSLEFRISPELEKLETYLLTGGKGEPLYTYRSVKEVRR